MAFPDKVAELVERFERNVDAYKSGDYKEARVRAEFIDPFFEALGWDMRNTAGNAEAYKDVVHEDSMKVGPAAKAPDYCFRIGGTRKFFIEAKRPSVGLEYGLRPAYQLRRYAWSAKLPLSILTSFRQFAVYDCRVRPHLTDKPSVARVMCVDYRDYPAKWDEIASRFSKAAILQGSFDKYADSARAKRGTAQVDDAFLKEIESWRDALARSIAIRNPALGQREVNYAVQATIDRIVFLRICEDRGTENYAQLMGLVGAPLVYQRLLGLFRHADERYNSGLFHFQREKSRAEAPDELTLALNIDDTPLRKIIKSLYYPDSPYEFSVLPADILGQVYEQFLGKVIRLTGRHAKVEDKPEVKKAGGVYYTPTYIVDYIVKNTAGKLLEGKTPKEVAKLRILDPACGSGSFLIAAYQFLLDWHADWYSRNDPERWARAKPPRVYTDRAGWRLTNAERKRILINNIFGVDIDSQAVEVTKLSLLLKILEGPDQLQLGHERMLPDLGGNIKCGNSLIGPDFYSDPEAAKLDADERLRVNVFDWNAEFAEIMSAGGFDAVIGNPPYVRMESFKDLKWYLRDNYAVHGERSDLYAYMLEQGIKLLRPDGRFGMIVSNKFLRAEYGRPLRNFLSRDAAVVTLVDLAGLPVFPGATVRTVVIIAARQPCADTAARYVPPLTPVTFAAVAGGSASLADAVEHAGLEIAPASLGSGAWTFAEPAAGRLLERLRGEHQRLDTYCGGRICMGVKSGLSEAFVITEDVRTRILATEPAAAEIIKPFLNGREVRRYRAECPGQYLIYAYHGLDIRRYPAIEEHLRPFKERLRDRATQQEWYELQQPQQRYARFLDGAKIVFPDIATSPRFALDDSGCYCANTVYFIPERDLFLLGLLNSSVASLYFRATCAGLEGKGNIYLRFFGQYLEGFPVPTDPADKARHDRMVVLVDQILSLHKQFAEARLADQKTAIQRQIDFTDRQIDLLVYELYGLTDQEIALVQEGV
jgi:hypothetical protein